MAKEYVPYSGPIVTYEEAKAAGLPKFFTGRPCEPREHLSQRYSSHRACVACTLERLAESKARDPEAFKHRKNESQSKRYRANLDENRAKARKRRREDYWRDPVASAAKALEWRKKKYPKQPKPEPTPEEIAAKKERQLALKNAARKRTYEKNKEKVLAQAAIYRAAHKAEEKVARRAHYVRNKEHVAKVAAAYRAAHPEMGIAASARRRARKLNAEGHHTVEDISRIRKMQKDRCAHPLCRKKLKGKGHRDHIIPLSKGGSNWSSNIQLLCDTCNLRKSAKDPLDFARENGLLL